MMEDRVPEGVIDRLAQYLGILRQLHADGVTTVSSERLGELVSVNPAQVRRDLTHFGSFGKRGVGYDVSLMIDRIGSILGTEEVYRLALLGAGHLGSAIAAYGGLRMQGFLVTAIFDTDPAKIGTAIGDIVVQPLGELEEVVHDQGIRIAVLAVPPEAAQDVTDRLAAAGIEIILNYTPMIVRVPPSVTLHNTDPVHELLHTLYYLSRRKGVARHR